MKLAGGRVPSEGRVMVRLNNSKSKFTLGVVQMLFDEIMWFGIIMSLVLSCDDWTARNQVVKNKLIEKSILMLIEGWGLICGDGWSKLEGAVVCRQLNLGFAQDAPQTDFFGGVVEDVVTTGVKCSGEETELAECYHHDLLPNATLVCPGNGRNFAAVICTDRMQTYINSHFLFSLWQLTLFFSTICRPYYIHITWEAGVLVCQEDTKEASTKIIVDSRITFFLTMMCSLQKNCMAFGRLALLERGVAVYVNLSPQQNLETSLCVKDKCTQSKKWTDTKPKKLPVIPYGHTRLYA